MLTTVPTISLNPNDWATEMFNGAMKMMAEAMGQAVAEMLATVGTLWMKVPTPSLQSDALGGAPLPNVVPATRGQVYTELVRMLLWIGGVAAIASIIALAVLMVFRHRRGEGFMALGKLGWVLIGILVISGSSAAVGGLLDVSGTASPTWLAAGGATLFLQSSMWWITGGVAAIATIIGGITIVRTQSGEPARAIFENLLRLILVAGFGVVAVDLLIDAGDSFGTWIVDQSIGQGASCSANPDKGGCLGRTLGEMFALQGAITGGVGMVAAALMAVIVFGLIGLILSLIMSVMMVIRSAVLPVLAGVWPISVAAGNTQFGKQWGSKILGWLVAFALFKPAAAICYAVGFYMMGSSVYQGGFYSLVLGVVLIGLSIIMLPVLIRLITPATAAIAGGAGAGAAMAGAAGMVATGAISSPRPDSGGSSGPSSTSGKSQSSAPAGAAPVPPSKGSPAGTGTSGGAAPAGAAGGGAGAAGAAGGAGAAGAAGGAAGAGAAAAAGPAAGAVVAAQAVKKAVDGAKATAQGAVEGNGGS